MTTLSLTTTEIEYLINSLEERIYRYNKLISITPYQLQEIEFKIEELIKLKDKLSSF